ncbi:hypothetical protein [Anaerotignum sp.]
MDKERRAKELVDTLAEEGLSMREAMDVLREADSIIRCVSSTLTRMKLKTALKDNMKAAEDYLSEGISPSE